MRTLKEKDQNFKMPHTYVITCHYYVHRADSTHIIPADLMSV